AQDSASAHRPSSSTMAPSSLLSAVARPSLRLCLGLACLHVGRRWHRLHLGPPVASAPPRPSGGIGSTSAIRILLVTLAHRLSVSTSGSSTTCSTAYPPPWLLSLSAPLAPPTSSPSCRLPGSSLHLVHPSASCFLLGSFVHRLHPGLCSSFHPCLPLLLSTP
ncbi:hypothetical protein M9458_001955, partial [Cirrhinus mrigala]